VIALQDRTRKFDTNEQTGGMRCASKLVDVTRFARVFDVGGATWLCRCKGRVEAGKLLKLAKVCVIEDVVKSTILRWNAK
jgi:hypothetical protein